VPLVPPPDPPPLKPSSDLLLAQPLIQASDEITTMSNKVFFI
jgi:hypothetical protein